MAVRGMALLWCLGLVLGGVACSRTHPPVPVGDGDADSDADADTDSDADADADADGDADADADADGDADRDDCTVGCDFASECGALPNQVRECHAACERGEVPRSLAACLAEAAQRNDCPSWGLCFEPTDGEFCAPWCDFAAECSFTTVEECLDPCLQEPPPRSVADCLEPAIAAGSCEQAVECFMDPLPEGFCEDLCARAGDCGFLDAGETVEECVDGCGPVAPEPLVECVLDALDGTCRDLAGCFQAPGPSEEQCRDVCTLRGDCNEWTREERATCEDDCNGRFDPGLGPCVERALASGACEEADACFGALNQPPDGYCDAACDFETWECELITPEETAGCVEFCTAGGQTDEFYTCRQAAIDAADCTAYLDCAP